MNENPFWDTDVYVRAINAVRLEINPYYFDESVQIYSAYPYHPYVLKLMESLDGLLSIQFWLVLCYTFSFSFFIHELLWTYGFSSQEKSKNITRLKFGLFLVTTSLIGGSSVIAVASGNISIFLHFVLIAVFLRTMRKHNTFLLLAVLSIFSAMVKPYFLTYLLLVFIYSKSRRNGTYLCVASLLLWFLTYFSAALLFSSSFNDYLAAVRYVTAGIQDWGYSFYGILRRRLGDELALLSHMVILALAIAFPLYLRLARNLTPTKMLGYFPLVLYFVICINPRMKEYDFGALIFVSLSSIYFLSKKLAYFSLCGCSILLLIRQLLLWLDANLLNSIPGNILYLKYWEVLMAVALVALSSKLNDENQSSQYTARIDS